MKSADQDRLRQWLAQAAVVVMVCVSVVAPPIVISSGVPFFKLEQLLIPVVVAGYVWLALAGIARTVRFNGMFLVGLAFVICNFISIVYGAAMLGHPVDYRDYLELPKVLLPVAFFTIAYESELSETGLRRLLICFSVAALLVCFYAWSQFFGLSFTYKLNPYYSSGGQIDLALQYARRVYATAGNANVLGELTTWFVVLFMLAAILRAGSRVYFALLVLACAVTLVMTGSRYGLLTLALGTLLVLAFTARRSLPKLAFALLLVPLLGWTYLTVAQSNTRTLQRYQTLSDPLRIDSLRQRLDELWPPIWADFIRSPVVGHGPGKGFLLAGGGVGGYFDSEYLGTLTKLGIVGLLVYFGYYLYPFYLMRRGQQTIGLLPASSLAHFPASITVLQASFIMGVLALVMNLGMSTFYSPFLQGFLWLWLGLGARCAATISASLGTDALCTSQILPSTTEDALR